METEKTSCGTESGTATVEAHEKARQVIEGPSGGALWRDYLLSVLNKPMIAEEVHHEVQTAA